LRVERASSLSNILLSNIYSNRGECQDASISKVLHNLVCSLTNTPTGQFESDAKACFDCEVMPFVLTCYHSTGAPLSPLQMWEQVLHHIIHKVKTAFGISTDGYSYSDGSQIHGPLQGSSGGPGSCSTGTSILIDAITRLCHGLQLCNPSQQPSYNTTTNMLVDDASNCTNRSVSWLHDPPRPRRDRRHALPRRTYMGEAVMDIRWAPQPPQVCLLYSGVEIRRRRPPQSHTEGGPTDGTADVGKLPDKASVTQRYLGNILSTDMQIKDASTALLRTSRSFASGILTSFGQNIRVPDEISR
jgi:hypothetical protein